MANWDSHADRLGVVNSRLAWLLVIVAIVAIILSGCDDSYRVMTAMPTITASSVSAALTSVTGRS
jgi:uncharacterized lipoprotein YajG